VAASNSTGRETLERPTRLVQVVIVCDIQPVLHPTTKSFEPSLEGLLLHVPHVGFERLSLNSDSRQRSPRQMTTVCLLKGANVYGALCRNGLICLACFQRYPITSPAALLYIWRYWLNTTATCIESTCGNISGCDARCLWHFLCRFHNWHTVMPFRPSFSAKS
jgi:hypothetical protein